MGISVDMPNSINLVCSREGGYSHEKVLNGKESLKGT